MTHHFIMWPKAKDKEVRASYVAKTSEGLKDGEVGERIQDNPTESADGLYYMVGSDRITEKQLDELKAEFPEIKTGSNVAPSEWVYKIGKVT